MSNLLQDLKTHLEQAGYRDISRDTLPDQPDCCIALFVFAAASDGTGGCTRYVQIQVRNYDPDQAAAVCWSLSSRLDSGTDEDLIDLTPSRWVIARPTARPKKLTEDEQRRSIYYCEVALFGADKE